MKIIKLILLFIAISTNTFAQKDINVANIEEYNKAIKNATPGTTIILKNGIWKDVHLKAFGNGEKENPIIVKAEKAGEVIISGDSRLQIYGEYIVVQGLWFKDGNPTSKSIVTFKKNSELFANNCRFTHNTISYYNPSKDYAPETKTHWVDLWGKNNRVDHNNFTGKINKGTTLVVWLKGEAHTENNHSIDANVFGPRPELGENGGETIRIGTSKYSMNSSKTIVENNTFKECNGEVEIISNKSCDNIYRNNLFISSQGALTLRHGNNALVENNVFIGNGAKKTGGIRVINKGHIIRNNLMIGLKGTGNRSPITVMNGVPNSPLNRYHQVENVNIQNNTLINCTPMQFAHGKDEEKSLPPITTVFANNLITNKNGAKISGNSDDISGIKFMNNIVETNTAINTDLYTKETIDWKLLKSIPMPSTTNENLVSNYKDTKTPLVDINGTTREPFVVGAFNLENTKYPKALTVKSGPYWKPVITAPKGFNTKEVTVEPGLGTLAKAIKKATTGTVILLKDGIYTMEKERKLENSITIIGTKNTIIQSSKEASPYKSFFKINSGIKLTLKNLTFNGEVNNIKYAIISPSNDYPDKYNLFIDNCKFLNFANEKGATIKAYTNTVADTISIKNSFFIDNFRVLNFHSKDNKIGTVNANNILISNTIFKNITEYAINYIQKPSIVKPEGGKLVISNSIFSKINNTEKGKVIAVKGITSIDIKNSVFENSFNIVNPINLTGSGKKISNCLVNACGKIKTTKGAIQKNILYKSPKWEDKKTFKPSTKSPLLKSNNEIDNIGLLFK